MDISQLTCHCGCGQNDATDDLIAKLNQLEERLGYPLCVTSGYRCPQWNNDPRVGGSLRSWHTTGQAVDIACDPDEIERISAIARSLGFGGIGVNALKKFVHLDLGHVRKWSYDEHGKVVKYV